MICRHPACATEITEHKENEMGEYRRNDLGYIMGLLAVLTVIVFLYGVFDSLERTREAPASATPATTEPKHVYTDVQPREIEFYSHNALFEGARISIKNAVGKVMWVQMPTTPMELEYLWPGRLKGWTAGYRIPASFDLTHGFEMVVHFKDGTTTRFERFEHIGDGHPYGGVSFYLHVCEGLRPHIGPQGTGEGEKHPVDEVRLPTWEETLANLKG